MRIRVSFAQLHGALALVLVAAGPLAVPARVGAQTPPAATPQATVQATAQTTPQATPQATVQATAQATAQATPQATPGPQALLEENGFPDNRNGWPIGTHRYIEGGRYHVVSEHQDPSRGSTLLFPKVAGTRDVVVEAELRLESGPGAGWHGLAARVGGLAAYRLLINRSGSFVLERLGPDDWEDVVTARPHVAIKPMGQPNVLRLAVKGDTLNVSVNGQHVAHVKDESGVAMRVGQVGLSIGGGQHVSVRRVLVTAATDADVGPPPARRPALEDMFFDNRNRWVVAADRPDELDNYFDEAGYHLAVKKTDNPSFWRFRNTLGARIFPADVVAEVEMTLLDGDLELMYGVALRGSEIDGRGYNLLITGDRHFALVKEMPNGWEWLVNWTPSAVIRPAGQPNVIRLVARGGALGVFINGEYVARVEDPTFVREGSVLLRVADGLHVAVRRMTVLQAIESDLPPLTEPPLLLRDTMRGNGEDWPVAEGEVYFGEDGYHLNALKQEGGLFVAVPLSAPFFSDVSLRADVRALEARPDGDVAFGIGVRVQRRPRQGYRFLIDHNGWFTLVRLSEGGDEPIVPWRRHTALRVGGELNSLRLSIRGNTLSVAANGQQLAVVQDAAASARWGDVQLISSAGAHVVVRRVVATGTSDQQFEPPPAPPALKPAPAQVTEAPCLPSLDAPRIEPWGVRVSATNTCGRPMSFTLGFVLLDKGQPVATTGTARWEAANGERRELYLPADTRGATMASGLATGAPAGNDDLICMDVGASRCLATDPMLRVAVDVLARNPSTVPLIRSAANSGVTIRRGQTQAGSSGVFNQAARMVTLHERLDAFSDWDRAAILAHELQHVFDVERGPSRTREECLRRESDAFLRTSEVWGALWQGRLPTPQNALQASINETTALTRDNPLRFARDLAEAYEHQCA